MWQGKSHLISLVLKRQTQCFGVEADRVIFCSSLEEKRLGDGDKKYFADLRQNVKNFELMNRIPTEQDLHNIWVGMNWKVF